MLEFQALRGFDFCAFRFFQTGENSSLAVCLGSKVRAYEMQVLWVFVQRLYDLDSTKVIETFLPQSGAPEQLQFALFHYV